MINTFQFDTAALMIALPEIFLLSAIVVVLLLDLFLTKPFKQVTYYLMQLSLLITGVLSFNLIGQR
jgi:NADH-quinone oxidoreductase subunit N